MDPTCQSLPPLSHTSSCAARRSNGGLPKLPAVRVVVEADPGFPAVGDAAKSPTTSPELATCLHSRSRSRSSPSPPCVRHERLLKLLAFVGPIRELRSTNSKSTSPEAPPPL